MKPPPLLRVTVTTSAEAEEAVADLLERTFALPASTHAKPESDVVEVCVFSPSPQPLSPADRASLKAGLRRIHDAGLRVGTGKISARRLVAQDWAESWRRHFRPLEFGRRLLVKPSWSRRRPKAGQVEIVIDPGLGFGTGQHATTAFCLEQIVAHSAHSSSSAPRSLLDVGTGSGILAVAAARLGFDPVQAFDNDPDAVEVARENLRRNEAIPAVKLETKSLLRLPVRSAQRFDVVCANLLADLLIAQRHRLANRLKPDGRLLLAGILKTEFDSVKAAYADLGLKAVRVQTQTEWQSGAFAFARPAKRRELPQEKKEGEKEGTCL